MKGIFPKMSLGEITHSLAGWNIPVSHEQLLRPSQEFVQTVYFACLQQISSITRESISDPAHSALLPLEDQNPVILLSFFLPEIIVTNRLFIPGFVFIRIHK